MNRCMEKTVNTRTSQIDSGPTITDIRLSRLRHPRASLFAMILLAAVFLLFGLFASAAEPAYALDPDMLGGTIARIGHQVLAQLGLNPGFLLP